jgi:predicted nucleic acid-binding protein
MPDYEILGDIIDVPRNLALLDTNVLVAYFNPDDALYENTRAYFEIGSEYEFAVTPPVVVETCGMFSARRYTSAVRNLMQWLVTPGNAIIFPSHFRPTAAASVLTESSAWMERRGVDYVDAYLMHVADAVTTACNLRPQLPIITYDTGDYVKSAMQNFKFIVIDMRDGQLIDFSK